MRFGLHTFRAGFALVAALVLATASLAAPASELSAEMQHAALYAASGADHVSLAAQSSDSDIGSVAHRFPDTPGHTHCGVGCHVQIPDARFAMTVSYVAMDARFVPLTESLRPAPHLEGLFRPPRA